LQLQADTQTTVTMLCLVGLHVLDKNEKKNVGKKTKTLKNAKKRDKKRKKFCLHV